MLSFALPRENEGLLFFIGATSVPLNMSDRSPQEGGTKVKKKMPFSTSPSGPNLKQNSVAK
jgi:hypothetical protein